MRSSTVHPLSREYNKTCQSGIFSKALTALVMAQCMSNQPFSVNTSFNVSDFIEI